MIKKFRKNQPLSLILSTVLLFFLAIGYNKLKIKGHLAEKLVFPQGIPILVEHNQSEGKLTLETAKLQKTSTVLGYTNENAEEEIKLNILNATGIPGLASNARELFTKKGFFSVDIGDAPTATYSASTIYYQPKAQKWVGIISDIVDIDFQLESIDEEKESTASASDKYDLTIVLATSSGVLD